MFMPALSSQASPEQLKKWQPLGQKYKIIGTYAQTEMGHGRVLRLSQKILLIPATPPPPHNTYDVKSVRKMILLISVSITFVSYL